MTEWRDIPTFENKYQVSTDGQVRHVRHSEDGNKLNNCATNLEWCTAQDNVRHAIEHNLRTCPAQGVYRGPVKFRCIESDEVFDNIRAGSKHLNISYYYLSDCVRNGKSCHGLHFEILN